MLLAISQKPEVLEDLQAALSIAKDDSKADILAAIDAIEQRNQHYFVDRKHTGKITLNLVEMPKTV